MDDDRRQELRDEMREAAMYETRYERRLRAHPDPRDPDHPVDPEGEDG